MVLHVWMQFLPPKKPYLLMLGKVTYIEASIKGMFCLPLCIVINILLKSMRVSNCGLAIRGVYAGAAVHADDLRTTSASLDAISDHVKIIDDFTVNARLNLNVSKLEVMKCSKQSQPS